MSLKIYERSYDIKQCIDIHILFAIQGAIRITMGIAMGITIDILAMDTVTAITRTTWTLLCRHCLSISNIMMMNIRMRIIHIHGHRLMVITIAIYKWRIVSGDNLIAVVSVNSATTIWICIHIHNASNSRNTTIHCHRVIEWITGILSVVAVHRMMSIEIQMGIQREGI